MIGLLSYASFLSVLKDSFIHSFYTHTRVYSKLADKTIKRDLNVTFKFMLKDKEKKFPTKCDLSFKEIPDNETSISY